MSDAALVTHLLRPKQEVARGLDAVLERISQPGVQLEDALVLFEQLAAQHRDDQRIGWLAERLRSELNGAGERKIDRKTIGNAFSNLAAGARRLRQAAEAGSKVVRTEGGTPTELDRTMMRSVHAIAERFFDGVNTPAASIVTIGGRVVSLGLNRAYAPINDFRRHGETEALAFLQERAYAALAQALVRHRASGGALAPEVNAVLDELLARGLDAHTRISDDEVPADVVRHAPRLVAFVEEGGFRRDRNGALHLGASERLDRAVREGLIEESSLAGWAEYEQVLDKGGRALTVYSSLEPCGMCLQNCVSHGGVARIVYGAADPAGGAVSSLAHAPEVYFSTGRVPLELIGGVEAEPAQQLVGWYLREVYPKVSSSGSAGGSAPGAPH